jgi:hypothetical protein
MVRHLILFLQLSCSHSKLVPARRLFWRIRTVSTLCSQKGQKRDQYRDSLLRSLCSIRFIRGGHDL